jgi:hypothetical protein
MCCKRAVTAWVLERRVCWTIDLIRHNFVNHTFKAWRRPRSFSTAPHSHETISIIIYYHYQNGGKSFKDFKPDVLAFCYINPVFQLLCVWHGILHIFEIEFASRRTSKFKVNIDLVLDAQSSQIHVFVISGQIYVKYLIYIEKIFFIILQHPIGT